MTDTRKTQTEVCKACGIVHSPRHWAEVAAQTHEPSSLKDAKQQAKETPEKHSTWQDKAGQFIARFSRSSTGPVKTDNWEDKRDEPKPLSRRSSSFARRDSGLGALDMRDGVINFRDEDGCYDHEIDHVQTKQGHRQ